MDINLIRHLIKNPTEIMELPSCERMPIPELLAHMARQPKIPHLIEHSLAREVLWYNSTHGHIAGDKCPLCLNRGDIMDIDDSGNKIYRQCICMVKRKAEKYAKQSGMGELLKKTFDDYICKENWQATQLNGAKYYLENATNEWYALLGQSGAGKTHLCSAICNELLKRGKRVVYMPWNIAVRELKETHRDFGYSKEFYKYAQAEILYIDDLFKGKINETDITMAFELINYRSNSDGKTLISSERSFSELMEIDEAIAGRIKERCRKYVVEIKGQEKNYRLKKQ